MPTASGARARAKAKSPTVAQLVDELGELKVQRKLLEEREEEIKTALQERGAPGVYLGLTWSVTVTVQDRKQTDWRGIVELSKIAPEVIASRTELKRVLVCNIARIAAPGEAAREA